MITSQYKELSTDSVIEYLLYYSANVKRYNYELGIKDITISIGDYSSFYFEDNLNIEYDSDFNNAYWYSITTNLMINKYGDKLLENKTALSVMQDESPENTYSFISQELNKSDLPLKQYYINELKDQLYGDSIGR